MRAHARARGLRAPRRWAKQRSRACPPRRSARLRAALARSLAKEEGGESGFVSYDAFQRALKAASLELQDQALITLMRKFHAGDAGSRTINVTDFLASL